MFWQFIATIGFDWISHLHNFWAIWGNKHISRTKLICVLRQHMKIINSYHKPYNDIYHAYIYEIAYFFANFCCLPQIAIFYHLLSYAQTSIFLYQLSFAQNSMFLYDLPPYAQNSMFLYHLLSYPQNSMFLYGLLFMFSSGRFSILL